MTEFYREIVTITKKSKDENLEELLSGHMEEIKSAIKLAASKGQDTIELELPSLTLPAKQELAIRFHKLGFASCVKQCDSHNYKAQGLYIHWDG